MATTALTKPEHSNGLAPLSFTEEQERMIRDTFAAGSTPAEFAVFMEVARLRRLNPITRQIHLVKRWNSQLGREVATPQTGIDGLRSIAERTGKYDGQDEPEFEYDEKKKLILARVKVYRKDWARPAVGVAHFSEYAQTKKDGSLTGMWASKPHIMLAKCAESLALRKAFPEDTGGLYTDEEMGRADDEGSGRSTGRTPGRNPGDAGSTPAHSTIEVNPAPATPKPNGKKAEVWKGVLMLANDYGFDCGGPKNEKLWELANKVLEGKPPKDWGDEEYRKMEAAISEAVAVPNLAAPPESKPEDDIPF